MVENNRPSLQPQASPKCVSGHCPTNRKTTTRKRLAPKHIRTSFTRNKQPHVERSLPLAILLEHRMHYLELEKAGLVRKKAELIQKKNASLGFPLANLETNQKETCSHWREAMKPLETVIAKKEVKLQLREESIMPFEKQIYSMEEDEDEVFEPPCFSLFRWAKWSLIE